MPKTLACEILSWHPEAVYISSFAFCYALEAIEVAHELRKNGCRAPIAFGGAGASCHPTYYLKRSSAEFVFQGEADEAIARLLHEYAIAPGVWRKVNNEIVHNEISIPHEIFPAISFIRRSTHISYYSGIFTRGCPMQCGFCSSKLSMPTFRKAALPLVEEVFLKTAWNGRPHLNIEDDAIVWDFDYLITIINYLKKTAGNLATFSLENGIDYRALDVEKVKLLAQSGLTKLNISLVSIHRDILEQYNRTADIDKFVSVVEAAHRCGVPTTVYFIAGLKGDTYARVKETLKFLSSLPVLVGMSPFYPVPGIQDFENLDVFDRISPRLCAGTSFYPWHDLTTDELVSLFCEARMINFQKKSESFP
ncbi:MAG: radical SAM protein [Spirochaetes bacterium]|nr:radical SAM protein [Spirochaetota bacterium]